MDGDAFPAGASAARTRYDRLLQQYLDKSVPHTGPRWAVFTAVVVLYALRVYLLHGFYIVTYGIAIFNLNLVIGFLSPAFDPEEGPTLPTTEAEFKPFVRRVPEFKFWCAPRARHAAPRRTGQPGTGDFVFAPGQRRALRAAFARCCAHDALRTRSQPPSLYVPCFFLF